VSTLLQRTLSVVIGAPIFLFFLWVGHVWLALLLLGLYVLGVREWSQVLRPLVGGLAFLPLAVGALFVLLPVVHDPAPAGVGVAGVLMASLIASFSTSTLPATGLSFFGALYVGWPLAMLEYLREESLNLALFVILAVWANDIVAYLLGSALGRHRLIRHISPNKTWEGALAGVLAAMAVGFLFARGMALGPVVGTLLGALVGILALVGDLVESQIKRLVAQKDSGTFLPGHGGVLDRFDAVLFAVPAVYYLLRLFGH
jgi:phosphatidate cytidylyltransferase